MSAPGDDDPTLEYESSHPSELPQAVRICPKCGGSMQIGFIPNQGEASLSLSAMPILHWVFGEPERSWVGVMKLKDRPVFYVDTYRCSSCGLLESVAIRSAL